jgi:hypothetical protein
MVGRVEGIINSMTPLERAKPELIKASRKRRIAMGAGAGAGSQSLLNQFEQTQMMKSEQGRHGQADARHEGHAARHGWFGSLISRRPALCGQAWCNSTGSARRREPCWVFRLAQAAVVAAQGAEQVTLLDIQIVAQDRAAVAQVGAQIEQRVVRPADQLYPEWHDLHVAAGAAAETAYFGSRFDLHQAEHQLRVEPARVAS